VKRGARVGRCNVSPPLRSLCLPATLQGGTGTKFGYECSSFADIQAEKTMLERSIQRGCRTVLSRTGRDCGQIYELLYDLSDDVDGGLNSFFLGHIVGSKRVTAPATEGLLTDWLSELKDIQKQLNYANRGLDFVTYTIPRLTNTGVDDVRATLSSFAAAVPNGRVGIDLNTEVLSTLTESDVSMLVNSILQPLLAEGALQVLTVASNPFTHTQAQLVLQWARAHNSPKLTTLATESVRCHSTRPGLLTGGYHYFPPHNVEPASRDSPDSVARRDAAPDTAHSKAYLSKVEDLNNAADDFQMAMDRCMQTEKIYLAKMASQQSPSTVAATDVCLAHVLGSTHAQFRFAEEWHFMYLHQIEQRLVKGLSLLGSHSKEIKDWTTIYQPMSRYLVASFRHLLQERSLLLCLEVGDKMDQTLASPAQDVLRNTPASQLPQRLAVFTAVWSSADYVTTALSLVDAEGWTRSSSQNIDKPYATLEQLNKDLRIIMDGYGDVSTL